MMHAKKFRWILPLEICILAGFFLMAVRAQASTPAHVVLTALPESVVADGYTSVELESDRITTDSGSTIPDGTVFTVTTGTGADATQPFVHAPFFAATTLDQNPERDGFQLKSRGGIVRFTAIAGTNVGELKIHLISDEVNGKLYDASGSIVFERHTPFVLDTVTIAPEAPTTTDSVNVTLTGNTPTPSWNVSFDTPKQYVQDGKNIIQIDITTKRTIDQNQSVSQVVQKITETKTLPRLTEAKSYLLRIFQNGTLMKEQVFNVYAAKDANVFSDVSKSYWAFDYIMSLLQAHIISGYEDGTFRPETSITRAELLKIVLSSAKVSLQHPDINPFSDLSDTQWYRDYVLTADRLGVATGVVTKNGNRVFAPNNPITRAEMLKVLFKGFQIPTVRVRELSFDDTEAWQNEYVETAVAYDLAQGYGNRKFGPNRPITRAEASKIIDRTRKLKQDTQLLSGSGSEVTESGKAGYYADSLSGHATASGELYDPTKFTAAHKNLPLGTKITVTNTANSKSVEVTVNDRGPYIAGRILDLSRVAFEAIANVSNGVIDVSYIVVSRQ